MPKKINLKVLLSISAVFAVLFSPAIASAAPTYTLYAYGSGYIEVGVLQGIAGFVNSGGFGMILRTVGVLGFFMLTVRMLISGFKFVNHTSTMKWFAGMIIVYSALLMPKCNVNVYDTVNNTTSNAVVVTGVPYGIGFPLSEFSQLQYFLTNGIEQWFSTPNTIDLTNAGMGLSLTSQNLATGAVINDPYLIQSFDQYVYNCVMPGISVGLLSSEDLTQAGGAVASGSSTQAQANILDVMAAYTGGAGASMLTTEFSAAGGDGSPQGTTVTCGTQTADIENDMQTYVSTGLEPQMAGALGLSLAQFDSEYGLINSSIYNMSSSASNQLLQMTAVNQWNQALIAAANVSGNNATALAYGTALAQQNMNTSFEISGVLAGQYMPVVYGLFTSLFLGFSLILIILMALPIGVNYFKMYMELALFLTVWPPLMAIYNYVDDLILNNHFQSLAMQGFSINSAHSVSMLVSSQLGWMGYLSWSVPIMSYALVTGSSYAMVGAISSMDSAGKSAAQAGGSAAASGNVSLGNDSMNNFNANKLNSVRDVASGERRAHYDTKLKDTSNKTISGTSSLTDNSHKSLSGTSSLTDNSHKSLSGTSSLTDNSHLKKAGTLSTTANGDTSTTDYKNTVTAQTNQNPALAGELLNKGLGIASDKGMDATVTEGAGLTDVKGMIDRQGLSNLIASGKLGGQALTEAKQALNSGKQEFYMNAQGARGHIAKIGIGNEQNVAMVTNGQQGSILTKKIGTDTQNGHFGKYGTNIGLYNSAGVHMSGLETYIRTNGRSGLTQGQKSWANHVLSGMYGQKAKNALITDFASAYTSVYGGDINSGGGGEQGNTMIHTRRASHDLGFGGNANLGGGYNTPSGKGGEGSSAPVKSGGMNGGVEAKNGVSASNIYATERKTGLSSNFKINTKQNALVQQLSNQITSQKHLTLQKMMNIGYTDFTNLKRDSQGFGEK